MMIFEYIGYTNYNELMSLKWYEQHLQAVVRQNQQLKFKVRKLQQKQPARLLIELFKGLFPDIPSLEEQDAHTNEFDTVADYYRKVVDVWLQKEKTKMDFLLLTPRTTNETSSLANSKSTLNLSKTFIQRRCRRCDQDRPSKDLYSRIVDLETQIKQLKIEMQQFEINEHKYLGEIAVLRSITKKLEYELSEKIITEGKLKTAHLSKIRKATEESLQLRREVAVWRGEYERIWQEQQQVVALKEEEVTEVNTSRLLQTPESSSASSNLWTIRSGEFQHSYITKI